MDKNLKILIQEEKEEKEPLRDSRLGSRINRSRALNAVSASGAKVRHDSGGRLFVIEATKKAEQALTKNLPGARIVPIDADIKDTIPDLDPSELLFLEALKVRTSKRYREAKKRRIPGETPEEKELFSAPCIEEED